MIYGGDFRWGIAALCVAAIWGISTWLVSADLQKKRPRKIRKQTEFQIDKYRRDMRRYRFWQLSIPFLIVFLFVLAFVLVNNKREEKELQSLVGWLIPGSDDIKAETCGSKREGGITLLWDGNASYVVEFPHAFIRTLGVDRLLFEKDVNGKVSITTSIFDPDGHIIATIEKGHFTINKNNYFIMERPDQSTLRIVDLRNNEVLHFRYCNPRVMTIRALLYFPGVPGPIHITEKEVNMPGFQYYNVCTDDTQADIEVARKDWKP